MIIGLIEIVLIFILYFLSSKANIRNRKNRQNFYVVAWVFLILIYLFKNNANLPDMGEYELNYRNLNHGNFEIGYLFLISLLNKISPDFWTFIVFYAFFITTVNVNLQRNYAVMPFFCLLLYVCCSFFSLFLVRQYMAMTICLLTVPHILNKRIFPFILLTLLATSFHTTAFIWLPVYFITYTKINYRWLLLLCVGSLVFIKSFELLFGDLMMHISKMESYITDSKEQYTWKTLVMSGSVLGYVMLCYGKNLAKLEGFEKFCLLMTFCTLLFDMINVIGTSFNAIYRVKPYFSMFIPFVLSYATVQIKKSGFKLVAVTCISILYIWSLIAGFNQQRGWFGFIF